MNYQQADLDESKSFHVSHVANECEVSNIKPVHHISTDVQKIIKESSRARLISQIVAAPDDYPARDIDVSSQTATKATDLPPFLTSHKTRFAPKRHAASTYPSLVQSLRWNPYVEMSSAENSLTDIVEENPKYNCKCESCTSQNCPSRVTSSGAIKPSTFKNNIMTFSDQYTMTRKLNDACCGVCIPIPTTPKVSDVCVPPDVAVRNTETVTNLPNVRSHHQSCNPMPILKRSDLVQPASKSSTYGYCSQATGHVPMGIRQEAVRDTDMSEEYCEPVKTKSFKNFFKFKKKPVNTRLILYNEGISDNVANACPIPQVRVPSPTLLKKKTGSSQSVKFKTKIQFSPEDSIPYTHRPESRYHYTCKLPSLGPTPQYSDADEVRHVVPSPPIVRKSFVSRSVRPHRTSSITLPRKLLTSAMDIESYIEKESNTELQICRLANYKKS